MRFISGKFGGQSLPGRSSSKLRPTSDKVKEAIFDQLQARFITDWSKIRVLDLYAGTGSLGFECLSRGAEKSIFIDHHLQTVKLLHKTAKEFELTNQVEIFCKGAFEAIRWLHKRGDRFHLIFLDPPYREDWVVGTLNLLLECPLLEKTGIVVVERDKRESITSVQSLWTTQTERRYGDSVVGIFSS